MNSQQENNCIAYFKSNPVWDRVFRGFWEKYRSYGSFSGKVVLQKITAEEVEGLEGFFAKSYHGKKSVTVSAERFSQALLSSRFSNMTPEHLLELYFREKLVGKKEERQLEEQKKDRFLQHWKEKYQGTPVEKVLSELLDVIKAGHIKNLNEWEQSLMLGAEIYNCFPFRKNETKYLAVFATEITGNPHAFDQKGSWGTFLYQVIQMELRQRKVFPQKSEIFPAFFRQRCFLAEGILIDDISNYVMLSHVKAQKKDGDLHTGMEGFWQEDDMVQVPLAVLSKWNSIFCKDNEMYIVENPSVFAGLCAGHTKQVSCMCMNGQPRLAGLVTLDLLAALTVGMLFGSVTYPVVKKHMSGKKIMVIACVVVAVFYIGIPLCEPFFVNRLFRYGVVIANSLALGYVVAATGAFLSVASVKYVNQEYLARTSGIMSAASIAAMPVLSFIISGLVSFVTTAQCFIFAGVCALLECIWILKNKGIEGNM